MMTFKMGKNQCCLDKAITQTRGDVWWGYVNEPFSNILRGILSGKNCYAISKKEREKRLPEIFVKTKDVSEKPSVSKPYNCKGFRPYFGRKNVRFFTHPYVSLDKGGGTRWPIPTGRKRCPKGFPRCGSKHSPMQNEKEKRPGGGDVFQFPSSRKRVHPQYHFFCNRSCSAKSANSLHFFWQVPTSIPSQCPAVLPWHLLLRDGEDQFHRGSCPRKTGQDQPLLCNAAGALLSMHH